MTNLAEKIPEFISDNGGQIIGKTRLQKSFYFLEVFGVGLDFDFQYYHFGPFSEELAVSIDDAIALKIVDQEWISGNNGYEYARFSVKEKVESKDDAIIVEERRRVLGVLSRFDAVTLELAATAHFLESAGYEDAWGETAIRKSSKATDQRIARAKQLLAELGSPEPN